MKTVRQSLFVRITSIIFIVIFSFIALHLFRNFDPDNYMFNILFIYLAFKMVMAILIITAYYLYWKIDFNNDFFIYYCLFRSPITIKYSNIKKMNVREVHYKDCIHDDLTFYLTNHKLSTFRISLPTNAENYSEFFNILIIKTEKNKGDQKCPHH